MPIDRDHTIRVAGSTYFVIGFVSALALFAGIGVWAEGHAVFGLLLLGVSIAVFCHFCFQKLVFRSGTLFLCRPLLPEKRVDLARVTRVIVALERRGSKVWWRCRMFDGEALLGEFNPKLFSFAGLDSFFAEVRAYAPTIAIEDGTVGFRPRHGRQIN